MMTVGRVAISLVITLLWGAITMGYAPAQSEGNQKLMDTLMCAVAFYWLGSSSGSDRKTELLGGHDHGQEKRDA